MTRRAIQWIGTAASASKRTAPGHAERLRRRHAAAQAREPVPDDHRDRSSVGRNFARYAQPQLRIEHRGGAREGLAREQVAPLRPDPGRVVVDFKQQRARGAQIGVERVVLLLLACEFRRRRVGLRNRRGGVVLGLGREFGQALRRRRQTRRHVGDRRLQGDAERIVLRPQALKVGVGEIRLPQRVLDDAQRVAGRFEIERPQVVGRSATDRRQHEGEGEQPQDSQNSLKCRRGQRERPDDSREAAPVCIRPWP